MTAEELFLRHLPAIERIALFVCRPNRLPEADVEDFVSWVKLALIENDYAIIRKFEARSSFTTFLTTVIHRLLCQHRTKAWGRWRPSAEARRLGDVAITLERLTTRDGFSLAEAISILTTGADPVATRAGLEALAMRLPSRQPRTMLVPEEASSLAVSPDADPFDDAMREDRRDVTRKAAAEMDRVMTLFEPEEQLILRLRFWQARSVAEIACSLHLDQKKTYKRIDRLLARLGKGLQSSGIRREDIDDALMAGESLQLRPPAGSPSEAEKAPAPEKRRTRPSKRMTGKFGGGEGKV